MADIPIDIDFPEDWDTDWVATASLRDGIAYTFQSGGKRVRPTLCLATCDALGGDTAAATVFAQAIEALHNYTLVHDDIMDGDTERRGQPAVWKQYGLDHGILIGDALHALGYRYLNNLTEHVDADTFQQLVELYTETSLELANGQSMEMELQQRDTVSEEEYMTMVEQKTGALLAAALDGACIIADADDPVREQITAFAERIGPAFQIRDDVIDLQPAKGRTPGSDIAEGKRSLIIVYALQRLADDDRDELLAILDADRDATTQDDIDRAISLCRSVDAIDDAQAQAETLVDEAKTALDGIDADVGQVEEIADFLVDRKF